MRELESIIPRSGSFGSILYELMLEYPLRAAKALRPALCIAVCRALGGSLEGVLKSASVLELYHNAFLIHDDVEDGSARRRDEPTLHALHGVPIAVNVGDAMLALALEPLLDNMRELGMGKALRILQSVARMARETAEGQALELSWIRSARWDLRDADYLRMVHKKTSWYTFLTPVEIGGMVAGCNAQQVFHLRRFATALGAAFQIRDDVLNLTATANAYGKDLAGDLWEGKHTLILMHAIRSASGADRERALAVLARPRLLATDAARRLGAASALVDELRQEGALEKSIARRFDDVLGVSEGAFRFKRPEDIEFLMDLIDRHGSVEHARDVAARRAARAMKSLEAMAGWIKPSEHTEFLAGLVDFVIRRDH
jgi:geranylgeranyl diphosphate synthase type II